MYLDNVYRNAHRHLHHKDNLNRNPTQELRDHRNRKWWKAMLSWTWYKRSQEGATQRRQGNWPEHEDILERILGETWQTTALQMNKKDWVHECRTKAQAYLKIHRLPIHPNTTPKSTDRNTNNNNNYNYNYSNNRYNTQNNDSNQTQLEEDDQEGTNEQWPAPHNSFKIIVDSKQLCDSINGTATLDYDNDHDYTTCTNITDKLIRIHQLGFNPAHKHLTPSNGETESSTKERTNGATNF